MEGSVKVFIENDQGRKEVQVEMMIRWGRPWFWFVGINPQRRQDLEKKDDEPTQEVVVMEEDTPEEVEAEKKTVLEEKVTTLEKEKEAMEKALREMEAKLAPKENTVRRCLRDAL